MSDLLALDPSINSAGVAVFRDGDLIATETIKVKFKGDILARCLHISEAMAVWALGVPCRPAVLVVEWPKIYKVGKSKVDPKDIVPLAGVAGCLAGLLRQNGALRPLHDDLECVSYLPKEWAGHPPKVETVKGCKSSPRALRIVSRLNHAERVVWDAIKYHDAIDAVGIGLKHLGRLERRRAISRG